MEALVDSGAQGNYISPVQVNKNEFPWKEKENPYELSTVEGTPVSYGNGTINLETDHLQIEVCGKASTITFDITDTAEHAIILGIPWLRESNPRIDWTTGQLSWHTAKPLRDQHNYGTRSLNEMRHQSIPLEKAKDAMANRREPQRTITYNQSNKRHDNGDNKRDLPGRLKLNTTTNLGKTIVRYDPVKDAIRKNSQQQQMQHRCEERLPKEECRQELPQE
jgi:hypothetical protein